MARCTARRASSRSCPATRGEERKRPPSPSTLTERPVRPRVRCSTLPPNPVPGMVASACPPERHPHASVSPTYHPPRERDPETATVAMELVRVRIARERMGDDHDRRLDALEAVNHRYKHKKHSG